MEDAVLLLEADHQLPIIDFDLSSLVASYCFFFVTVFFFFNSSSKLLLWNTGLKTTAKKEIRSVF